LCDLELPSYAICRNMVFFRLMCCS